MSPQKRKASSLKGAGKVLLTRELNWYSLGPGDFKSPVSTDSTTAAKISFVPARN